MFRPVSSLKPTLVNDCCRANNIHMIWCHYLTISTLILIIILTWSLEVWPTIKYCYGAEDVVIIPRNWASFNLATQTTVLISIISFGQLANVLAKNLSNREAINVTIGRWYDVCCVYMRNDPHPQLGIKSKHLELANWPLSTSVSQSKLLIPSKMATLFMSLFLTSLSSIIGY